MRGLIAQARTVSRLGLLVFLWSTAYAQTMPSGDSYTNTVGPSINYLSRAMIRFAAIELAFTILAALACAGVLALAGIYVSNESHSLKGCRCEQNRSSLNRQPYVLKAEKLLFLPSLIVTLSFLVGTGVFAQITPSADAYTNTVDPTINYGAKTLLDVDGAMEKAR